MTAKTPAISVLISFDDQGRVICSAAADRFGRPIRAELDSVSGEPNFRTEEMIVGVREFSADTVTVTAQPKQLAATNGGQP